MKTALIIFQVVVSILFILSVLVQQRSAGLSATFGGSGTYYASKRGAEKVLSNASFVLGALFVLSSIAYLFV